MVFAAYASATQHSAKPTGTISVKQILDKYLDAIGGIENLRAARTLRVSGTFSAAGTHPIGDFHFLYKAPSSDLFEFDAISHGESGVGRRDGTPFFKKSPTAAVIFNGVSAGAMEQVWRCFLDSDLASYQDVQLAGLAEINRKWAYALRFVPKSGDPQLRYYDSVSFLLTRLETVENFRTEKNGPPKAYIIDTDFEDYQTADNLHLPRQFTSSNGKNSLQFQVESVRINVLIDDSQFSGN
jgi:zinc protease